MMSNGDDTAEAWPVLEPEDANQAFMSWLRQRALVAETDLEREAVLVAFVQAADPLPRL
jgi:hypothetical protein